MAQGGEGNGRPYHRDARVAEEEPRGAGKQTRLEPYHVSGKQFDEAIQAHKRPEADDVRLACSHIRASSLNKWTSSPRR